MVVDTSALRRRKMHMSKSIMGSGYFNEKTGATAQQKPDFIEDKLLSNLRKMGTL